MSGSHGKNGTNLEGQDREEGGVLVVLQEDLRSDEREEFDRLLKSVRSRSSACGMLPASDELEPALLAMLVELSSRISKLEGASKGDA